jgi:putative metallohydrolase (TIGR04338 family)
VTRLQEAAYAAQRAAALPRSALALELLSCEEPPVDLGRCRAYLHAVQGLAWFRVAFPGHADRVTVCGGRGISRADAEERWIRIGVDDRRSVGDCEQACLHELAHLVTPDRGPDHERREPAGGPGSSKGHHHAWRANFVHIVGEMLGSEAARRLREEFNHWGLPTHR